MPENVPNNLPSDRGFFGEGGTEGLLDHCLELVKGAVTRADSVRLKECVEHIEGLVHGLDPDNDRNEFIRLKIELGLALWYLAESEGRLENLLKSVNVYESMLPYVKEDADDRQKSRIYNNLGIFHASLASVTDRKRNLSEALEWYEKAYEYAGEEDADNKIRAWINKAGAYQMLADIEYPSVNLERAKTMAKRALALSDEEADPRLAQKVYSQLGSILTALAPNSKESQKYFEEAAAALRKGLSLLQEDENAESKSVMLAKLGYVYLMLGRNKERRQLGVEGVGYLYQAIEVARNHGLPFQIGWAYNILSFQYARSFNPLMWLITLYYLVRSVFYYAQAGQSIAVIRVSRSILGLVARITIFVLIGLIVLRWVLG